MSVVLLKAAECKSAVTLLTHASFVLREHTFTHINKVESGTGSFPFSSYDALVNSIVSPPIYCESRPDVGMVVKSPQLTKDRVENLFFGRAELRSSIQVFEFPWSTKEAWQAKLFCLHGK